MIDSRPIFQFDQAEGLVGSGANFSKAIKNKKKQPNQTPLPQGLGLKHTTGQKRVLHPNQALYGSITPKIPIFSHNPAPYMHMAPPHP